MPEVRLAVLNPTGLHVRPAALFVRTAAGFQSRVRVRNLSRGGKEANAKSLLSLLTLGVAHGHEVLIVAEGPDAEQAIERLRALLLNSRDESEA